MTCPSEEEEPASLDARIESLLTRGRTARYQLWQPLLGGLLVLACIVLFATLAVKGEDGDRGPAGFAHAVAQAPLTAKRVLRDFITRYNPRLAEGQRFAGQSGFSRVAGAAADGEMLLLSRHDGREGVVELVDLSTGEAVHVWRPDVGLINARSKLSREIVDLRRDFNERRYLAYHPWPEDDGSLIFHEMGAPLAKIDACSRLIWTTDGLFNHSLQRDADGAYWTPEYLKPPTIEHVGADFHDDAIVKVSSDGEVQLRRSLAQILIDAGFSYLVYSHDEYVSDPLHLNDIEPALEDGRYWRKGDLFLSIRNPSMIALYRPSTDRILWSKRGPWRMQHDVDILSDHEIGVYNNNGISAESGIEVYGVNDYLVYDFATDKTRSPYKAGFEALKVRTRTNGLGEIMSDGSLMVGEQNFGRVVAFDQSGAEQWRYINRAEDGRIYQLGWSRILAPERARRIMAAVEKARCRSGDPAP